MKLESQIFVFISCDSHDFISQVFLPGYDGSGFSITLDFEGVVASREKGMGVGI